MSLRVSVSDNWAVLEAFQKKQWGGGGGAERADFQTPNIMTFFSLKRPPSTPSQSSYTSQHQLNVQVNNAR